MVKKGLTVESTGVNCLSVHDKGRNNGGSPFLIYGMTKRQPYAPGFGRLTWKSSRQLRKSMD